jgi:hypothetical protein
MRKAIVMVMAVLLLAACQEEHDGLYVNSSCSQKEYGLVEQAINKLNDVLGDEYIDYQVDLAGWDKETKSPMDFDYTNDQKDVIYCIDQEEEPMDVLIGNRGFCANHDIFIKISIIRNDEEFLHVIMHELGHYVGVSQHLTGKEDVMSDGDTIPTEYTDADAKLIIESLDL